MKSKFLSMILIILIVLSTMSNALANEEYNEEDLTKYEFIGNYNYGYTGHFLFSLKVFKIGSFTVAILGDESTFDLANEYGDQQVIHFAYTDAEIFAR